MPLRCADCDHQMLLTPGGATGSIACENCGGKRLLRDQPTPTHSDGDLRDMVDPGTGLDQGGNPNMEGIWANNGWQNYNKRDESYASVRTAMDFGGFDFESEPRTPSHHVIVDKLGSVYSGAFPETHEDIADRHRLDEHDSVNGTSKGAVYPEGDTDWYTHDSGHSPQAMEQMLYGHFGRPYSVSPDLESKTEGQRWGIEPGAFGNGRGEVEIAQGPPSLRQRGMPLDRNEGLVRGGSLDTEAYASHFGFYVTADEMAVADPTAPQGPPEPQYHQEGVLPGSNPNATRSMLPGHENLGIHAGTTKWLGFLDARVNGMPVRGNESDIISQYGGRGEPVMVSAHHPDHLAAAIDVIEHSSDGGRPSPRMIEVGRAIQRGELQPPPGIGAHSFRKSNHISKTYGIPHLAFLPLLLGLGAGLAGGAAEGGLASVAAPFLMRGALMGAGSNMVQGLMGGGGGEQQAPQMEQARDETTLSKVADIETPHTNPGFHDDPDGDPHQFKDQSHSTNPENPNIMGEGGGSQLGEDNVPGGFGPNSPSMSDFNVNFPKVLHWYHSDESGAHDPILQALHNKMDAENPGYLDRVDDEQGAAAVQHLIERLRDPGGVHASTKESVGMYPPPMSPGILPINPQQQPQMMPQVGPPQPEHQGNCSYCGGTVGPDGKCPQCGAMNGPFGVNPQPGAANPAGAHNMPTLNTATPFVGRTAADTQGPVSKEQQAAVAQLLIDSGRHEEIPVMLQQPELYAKELAQVTQNQGTQPPSVDPNQTPPPPPPPAVDPSQMAQMPVPGMSVPPGAGGSPSPYMGRVATPVNGAPRCPKCHSATTGFLHNSVGEVSGDCHSCGNVWAIPQAEATKTTKVAGPDEHNPAAVSQPEREHAYDPENDQDSSHTWQDADGDPIMPGQEYELFTAQYPIPDRVRIDQVKPDEIVYSTIGEFDPNPQDPSGTLTYENRITREEFQLEKYQFQKPDQDSQQSQQPEEGSAIGQTPQGSQFTEPVQQPTISPRGSVEMPKGHCPKCAGQHIANSMSSPTTTFHECYKCGHVWESREEDFETDGAQQRSWIMSSSGPGNDDFWSGYERAQKMGESAMGSRSLAAVAARDPRLRAVSERLEANKMAREAGKKFSPYEQRQFIDEKGTARNADMLDLSGTHYESHRYLGERANGMNVPDEELFLGI